jgi:PAS domain S-box-containing protein
VEKNTNNLHQDNNDEINNFSMIFDTYLGGSSLGFALVDPEFIIVYVNKALEKITGYTKNEIIGKNLTEFITYPSEETRNLVAGYTMEATKDSKPLTFEFDLAGKEGRHKWIEITIIPFRKKENETPVGFIINMVDKSEIKSIQEQWKLSTYAFRAIHEGTIITNTRMEIIHFNSAAENIFKIRASEAIGKKIFDAIRIIHPSEDELRKQFEDFETDKEGSRWEHLIETPQGQIWAEVFMQKIRDENGKHIANLAIVSDITERKKAEEALRLSDQAFKAIREAIVITTLDDAIVLFWNKACEDMYHIKAADAIGKRVTDVLHIVEPSMEQIHKDFLRLKVNGFARYEHLIQVDKNKNIWIELLAQIIKDANGENKGVLNIALDITERKKMEEQLRKSEASLAEAQGIAKLGSWYLDLENDELVWSDELYRLFGYHPGEVTPTKELFLRQVYPDDLPLANNTIYAHESGEFYEESSNIIIRFLRKNGGVWYGNLKARSVFDDSGKVIKELGSIQDISDIREAEEREKGIQQKLTIANRLASIREVTSGLVHEINNPLTGVLGFSQLLIDRDIPSDIKEDIEVINREAQRAAKIVSGLLTFAYQDEPGFTVSDINRIIRDTIDLRSYEMEMNNIKIVTDLDENLPQIAVDEIQLQQAFLNIILNAEQAIKSTRKKGVFTVKTEYNNNIRISFTDNGPGISKEKLGRIFTPFFNSPGTSEGLGLGLSMTYNIITRHGGKIFAESELGHGTKFIIELPVTDAMMTS